MNIPIKRTQFRMHAKSSDGFISDDDIDLLRKFIRVKLEMFLDNKENKNNKIEIEKINIDKKRHNLLVAIWYDTSILDCFNSREDIMNLIYKFYFEYVEIRNRGI